MPHSPGGPRPSARSIADESGKEGYLFALSRPFGIADGATPVLLPLVSPLSGRLAGVRVYLGSDHAGFELKTALISWLREAGHDPVDCGPATYVPDDDYPVYVMRAARAVIDNPGSLGIVIGGSGNGEQIASNKIPGIRAAVAWTDETAQLARQHNDANVLSLGARMYSISDAVGFAKVFVETPFSQEPRHARRLEEIAEYEKTGELPPLPGA
jgi:ribose 5-phosphate isomerase B